VASGGKLSVGRPRLSKKVAAIENDVSCAALDLHLRRFS
jgi:hypothetical protein